MMRSVLHLLTDLGPHGLAKQAALVAPRLPRERFQVQVATCRPADFHRAPFEAAGIPVSVLGPSRPFPPMLCVALRRLLRRLRPDIVHAWGWPALRQAAAATWGMQVELRASDTAMAPQTGCWDRWCLRRTDRIALPTGIADNKTTIVPFCVQSATRAAEPCSMGLPAGSRLVVAGGTLTPAHGVRDAIHLFDILSHVYGDIWLMVIGEGPQRPGLEEFAEKLGADRVRFAGWDRNSRDWVAAADLVLVCGDRGGRNLALEALAAGAPVLAWSRPDLCQMLGDAAQFGPRGDFQASAIGARRILDDPAHRSELVSRGRARAAQWPPDVVAARWAEWYESPSRS